MKWRDIKFDQQYMPININVTIFGQIKREVLKTITVQLTGNQERSETGEEQSETYKEQQKYQLSTRQTQKQDYK